MSIAGDGVSVLVEEPPVAGASAVSTHRWRWVLLILSGTLAVIGGLMLRPGGSVQGDVTPHVGRPSSLTLPAFGAGQGVEQPFVAEGNGLSDVTVRFGTSQATGTGTVVTQLLAPDGTVVAVSRMAFSSVPDAKLIAAIRMPPQADSKGRTFRLRISLSADADHPLTTFAMDPTPAVPAARQSNGRAEPLAMEIHLGYGNDRFAFDQIATALRRIGEYGPIWRRGASIVLLSLGAVALLAGIALVPRRRGLVVLLAFVVVKGVLWSAVIPPMLGVDEGFHVSYAQYMAVDHAIPKRGSPQGVEGSLSADLAAANSVFHQGDVPRSDRADYGAAAAVDHRVLGDAAGKDHSNGDGPAAGYSPLYYSVPALAYMAAPGTIDVKVGVMRLWSVLLGAVAVYFAVRMARLVFAGRESAALLLGAAVALQPMLSQQTAVVNNDAGTIAAGAACGYLAVLLTSRNRSRWVPAAAGLAFGLGLMVKPLVIAFAPALAVGWIVGRRRGCRRAPWWWEAGTAAAGVGVTYGAWAAFSAVFGYAGIGLQPQAPGNRTLGELVHLLRVNWFEAVRVNWVDQFWGNFGWINTPFPPAVQAVITVALLVGAGLVIAWVVVFLRDLAVARRGRGPMVDPAASDRAWATAVCVLVVSATLGEIYVLVYEWYMRVGEMTFVQGRYALMVVPVVLVLPVAALQRLWPRLSPIVSMGVVTSAMGVLNLAAMALIVERFYL